MKYNKHWYTRVSLDQHESDNNNRVQYEVISERKYVITISSFSLLLVIQLSEVIVAWKTIESDHQFLKLSQNKPSKIFTSNSSSYVWECVCVCMCVCVYEFTTILYCKVHLIFECKQKGVRIKLKLEQKKTEIRERSNSTKRWIFQFPRNFTFLIILLIYFICFHSNGDTIFLNK